MFGRRLSHSTEGNKVFFKFQENVGRIEVINPCILNVFSPLKYDNHYSRAIEDLEVEACEFSVATVSDYVEIKTSKLIARVYDDFKVNFYNVNGEILCEDLKQEREPFIRRGNMSIAAGEGHKVETNTDKHKIEVIKKMFGDEKFYGLGDKTGHLNKRGYGYEMWNTDDPSPMLKATSPYINPYHFS